MDTGCFLLTCTGMLWHVLCTQSHISMHMLTHHKHTKILKILFFIVIKWLLKHSDILIDQFLAQPLTEKLPPEADGNRYREPQTENIQWGNLEHSALNGMYPSNLSPQDSGISAEEKAESKSHQGDRGDLIWYDQSSSWLTEIETACTRPA